MRPWRRPSGAARANWDTRATGSSTRRSGAFSASASRCSRKSIRTSRPAPRDPRWLTAAIERDWPGQYEVILEANNAHLPLWLRVNSRADRHRGTAPVLEAAGFSGHRDALAPDALRVEPAADVHSLPGFAEAWCRLSRTPPHSSRSSCSPPLSGERILDACAAPGGKTCHILERTGAAPR